MNPEHIKTIFTAHQPDEETARAHRTINDLFLTMANALNEVLPDGPGLTAALRKLSEARMQANACLATKGLF